MIDTIRFRIPVSFDVREKILAKCVETSRFDHISEQEIFRFSRQDLELGSFDRKVSIYLPDDDYCILEFSVPKFLLGHNVFLISFEEFWNGVCRMDSVLKKYFGDFPDYNFWEIMRIDLCYAWKFQEQSQAESMLDLLANFNFPRKKKCTYDTSVMYIGKTYSLKFYLKYPEYFTHDFRFLRDHGYPDFAYNILNVSRGVLRFEATLRSQYLHYHFGKKHVFMEHLTKSKLFDMMVSLFGYYMGGFDIKYATKRASKKRLQDYFGKKKGGRLWVFYIYLLSEGKQNLLGIYEPSTIYQYLREIREAGIKLSYKKVNFDNFQLSIPSKNVVNDIGLFAKSRKGRANK